MQVVLAEPAERDLASIIDYIALDNAAAAKKVFRSIESTLFRLADFPELGRPGRLPGTRELRIASLPYLVVYEATADLVTVVAVFHTARDLKNALAKRKDAIKP